MIPEKIARKSFDRRDRAHRWKLWVKVHSSQGASYRFFWRRIALATGIGLAAFWIALAGAVWANARYRRGVSEARFADLALPWRWTRYRSVIARHYLDRGRAELRNGYPAAALTYFEALLALEPENLENRRLAAQAQFQLGFRSAALSILRPGLAAAAAAGDEGYLSDAFYTAFDLQDDDEALAEARRLLPPRPDDSPVHRYLAIQAATALYNRGRDSEAEGILEDWGLRGAPEGEALWAFCETEAGRGPAALKTLEADLGRFRQGDVIYLALERLARAQGLTEAARRYAFLRGIAEPGVPQARIDLIVVDQSLGRREDLRSEIRAYLDNFRSDRVALNLLLEFAAGAGEPDVAETVRTLIGAQGPRAADIDLELAQASIVAGDFRRALAAVARARADSGPYAPAYEPIFAGFNAVAELGSAESGAELAFTDFLPLAGRLRPSLGLALVLQLRRLGFRDQGRQMLERICAEHPDDEPALAELVRTQAAAGDRAGIAANLARLLDMRKPPRDAVAAALPLVDPREDGSLRARAAAVLSAGAEGPPAPGG
jgi:tetratricopeptide (TPR) repeat protein